MEQGKISVIVPVYNGAAWIAACLKSILAQTYTRFEVLVLDDHSQDGTADIVRRIQREDARVRFLQRDKSGVSSARNQGIEETDGEFLTFVDADDVIDRQIFDIWINILNKEKSDIALCNYIKIKSEDAEIFKENDKYFELNENSDKNNNIEYNKQEKQKNNVINIDNKRYLSDYILRGHSHCWGILYRRQCIGGVRFREDLTIGEDMMFLVDLLPRLFAVSVTAYPGYGYRVHAGGAMLRPFVPSYMDEIKSWELAADRIRRDFPDLNARASGILAVSAVLTAGKIAVLPPDEQKQFGRFVEKCRETVRQALKTPGAKRELPGGYKIKTALLSFCPNLYLGLYHLWKR